MKKLLILLVISLASIASFSQALTVSELFNLIGKNYDEFDTYATSKGYKYLSQKTDSSQTQFAYTVADKKYDLCYYQSESKFPSISYNTPSQKEYLTMKLDLIKMGYKFVKQSATEKSLLLYYRRGEHFVVLSSNNLEMPNGSMQHYYSIDL